ncbi:hypothetical protein IW138_003114 [Coemansia sp. RSA 986]|nr:hypothetical protein IW138_003114 [Coemansia sp. RSA 986]
MEEIGNKSTILGSIRSILLGDVDSDQRVWELMNDVQVQALVGRSHRVNGIAHAKKIRFIARLPHWVPFELKRTAISFADQWYHLSQSKRCVYTLVGINAVVFGMWHIPRLLPLMARSFLHDPRSGRAYTMLTSTFSHKDFLHFAFNNIALVSFGTTLGV